MQRRCQVTRDGEVIGEHDEPTMLALLNAGALRLTDSYWHSGMKSPVTLADYLCHRRDSWLRPPRVWLLLALPCALIVSLWLTGHQAKPVPAIATLPVHREKPPIAQPQHEIRRATPIIRGRFEASLSDDGIHYPQHTVERLASHSRVAVIAYDAKQHPLGLGSGIVIDDGHAVLTATEAVAGASRVEVQLANGTTLEPTTASIDDEFTILKLPSIAVPVRWAEQPISAQAAVALCNHPLGESPGSAVQVVQTIVSQSKRVHYALDAAFAPSTAGSAMLNAAGELAGVLVDPANGRVLRAADVRALMKSIKAQPVASLASRARSSIDWPLAVNQAEIVDGKAVVTLRNDSGETLHRIVLHLRSYALPPEASEVRKLEEQFRSAAVQSAQHTDEITPEALALRQVLREVSTRLEAAQERLRAAMTTAREATLRSEIQVIEGDLAPGTVQRVVLDIQAASNWGVVATVLEAVM